MFHNFASIIIFANPLCDEMTFDKEYKVGTEIASILLIVNLKSTLMEKVESKGI